MNHVQLSLILGFYILDKEKNFTHFTKMFNKYFIKDFSPQTLLYEVTKFKEIDPSNNLTFTDYDSIYSVIWTDYIASGKINELKELYNYFKKGVFLYALMNESDKLLQNDYNAECSPETFTDIAHEKPTECYKGETNVYNRSAQVVANALAYAKNTCEYECGVNLFLRKDNLTNYTEAHHLIPLSFQNEFPNSLDVEANVISLCPACHRRMHYGSDIEIMLNILFDKRVARLEKCGIYINYDLLLLIYR